MKNKERFNSNAMNIIIIPIILLLVTNFGYSQSTSIKDGDNNLLIDINDEGNYGSITIYPWLTGDGPQVPIDNKLYNRGGGLCWGTKTLALNGSSGWTDAGSVVRLISSSDNVGIGTSTPTEKLDVVGNINLSGIIKLDEFSFLSNIGNNNVLVGKDAGNSGPVRDNTIIGYHSGYNNTGEGNTLFGYYSGFILAATDANTFYGSGTGSNVSSGEKNTYLGYETGKMAYGDNNTYIGNGAGLSSSLGDDNTFIGAFAGRGNAGTNRDNNVFCGYKAGHEIRDGDRNTCIGTLAGYNTENTIDNTFVGYNSGRNNDGSSNVFIGNESGKNAIGSNILYIENSDSNTPLIGGDFSADEIYFNANVGIGTNTPDEKFEVEFEVTDVDIDIEIGQGVVDTDITFFKLTSPNGTPYYIYVDVGGNLTSSTTKP